VPSNDYYNVVSRDKTFGECVEVSRRNPTNRGQVWISGNWIGFSANQTRATIIVCVTDRILVAIFDALTDATVADTIAALSDAFTACIAKVCITDALAAIILLVSQMA
jgi:hypothetical protein